MNMAPKTKASSKEKSLTSQEVEAIIRLCSQLGVTELNFGNLQIKFEMKPQAQSKTLIQATADVEISETQHKENTKQAIEQEEIRTKEETLAFATIENPLLAEEMLDDGDLLDDDELDYGSDRESTRVEQRAPETA